MNVPAKIKEAEVYQSMGLPEEALNTYQHILVSNRGLDPKTREKVKEKILLLRKEISAQGRKDGEQISHEDINTIKQAVNSHGGIQGILDKAEAFKEIGLYGEAVEEYKKLFRVNYPKKEIVAEISGCLLGQYPPFDAVHRVVNLLCERASVRGKKSAPPLLQKSVKIESQA